MIYYFCFQATSAKWINSANEYLNLLSRRWLKFTRTRVRYFISFRIVALKNAIWSRSDELKDAFLKGVKTY